MSIRQNKKTRYHVEINIQMVLILLESTMFVHKKVVILTDIYVSYWGFYYIPSGIQSHFYYQLSVINKNTGRKKLTVARY